MAGLAWFRAGASVLLAVLGMWAPPPSIAAPGPGEDVPAHMPDGILVRFEPAAAASTRAALRGAVGADLDFRFSIVPGLERLKLRRGRTVDATMQALWRNPNVIYAEPDYVVHALREPNDPSYPNLWGMANIKAPQAWDTATGSSSVAVAVIDTGIDRNHPDLQANIWTNPGEVAGNGLDDDANGYVDDVHGWDFAYNDNDPSDVDGHGTHVAGTIGAVGNNGIGVTGVNWQVKLVALKFLNDQGSGSISDAIKALEYARNKGIPISNNSWGGGPYGWALNDAIATLQADGHLFVAAAGNDGFNNDALPHYPSSYNLSNVIAVASITSADTLSSFSNYGATSVDIAAPGSLILSTVPNGSYATYSGTSMAAPHVAGAAALLRSRNPTWTYGQLREMILRTARPIPTLAGVVATGGTLDVHAAMTTPTEFPQFSLSPSSIAFGELLVGRSTVPRTVSISNTGTQVLPIDSISLITSDFGQFSAAHSCPTSLAIGAGCSVDVVFKPTTAGVKKATLHVAGGKGAGSKKAALSGTGVVPVYSLTPTSLDFGEQVVGGSVPAKTVTLKNTGSLPLPISWIGPGGSLFSATHNCGTSVAPGASCSISIVFTPTYGGTVTDYLYVYGGDGAETKRVNLSGTGLVPTYTLTPDTLDFGEQAVGGTSAARTISLRNTGSLTLPITSIGAWNYRFAVTHDCGTSVAPGASCTISARFVPDYGGAITEYLYVYGGAGAETKYAVLSGVGLVPTYELTPGVLSFGEQAVGGTSAKKSVTLRNTGALPLSLTSIGAYLYNFGITHDCGTSVPAGASCTIDVSFAPTYGGQLTENLSVSGANGAETKYVLLSGTGVVPVYTLTPEAMEFGEVETAQTSATKTIILANTGSVPLPITSIGQYNYYFRVNHDCGSSVPAGASCSIGIKFAPTYAGEITEYLYVYGGNGAESRYATLHGTGVAPLSGHEPGALQVPASDADGSFNVSWGPSSTAGVQYVLEEATDVGFNTGRRIAYQGPGLVAGITGRRGGFTYFYRVKAKLSGYTDSAWVSGANGCVVPLAPATAVTLTPSPSTFAVVGSSVSFVAAASGGNSDYQYKYLLRAPGGALSTVREYSTVPGWSWKTIGSAPGTYQVVVHARSLGSTRSHEVYESISFSLVSPVAAVTLAAGEASPSVTGTAVTFTAAASGGSGSYEYKYLLRAPGGSLNIVRDYSSAATWNWTTIGLMAGTYQVAVHARTAGSSLGYEAYQSLNHGLVSPASSVTLTAGLLSPMTVGAKVPFTAAASGGSGSYQYKFLVRPAGGSLGIARDYSSSATWDWATAGLAPGTYQIVVHARSVGSTKTYEVYQSLSFVLAAPAASVNVIANVGSPAAVGTTVIFTASASGGSGSYEYRYALRLPGGALTTVRDYSTSASWSWSTAGLAPGTYQLVVHARNTGSTAAYETYQSLNYSLRAPPATSVSLTPSIPSPATVGATVIFSAAAAGGSGSYEYSFLLRSPGGALATVRAYSRTSSWTWNSTGLVAGTYQVVVRARNAGSTESYETYQSLSYVLTGT